MFKLDHVMNSIAEEMERELGINMKNLTTLPPDLAMSERNGSDMLHMLRDFDLGSLDISKWMKLAQNIRPKYPPLKVLPCANVQVRQYQTCPNPGTSACSACRLVSYCSKECQKAHWPRHKRDCKNPLRSPKWKAPPAPMSDPGLNRDRFGFDPNNKAIHLWGNIPATDIINLGCNEQKEDSDLSIAFAASGDLRHVIATVNALPDSYSGHLTILVNDHAPWIVSRNITLLVILTSIEDIFLAADIALHFWYSVFMPGEYRTLYTAAVTEWYSKTTPGQGCFTSNLTDRCSASFLLATHVLQAFRRSVTQNLDLDVAQTEYDRVRQAPFREEERNGMYEELRPSHRIAFEQYRRFGIILPHGAVNAHFNCANSSLFSEEGKWLQTDYADPLEGWDIDGTISCGKRYGANPEDIYGCLYFRVMEQLQIFAQRLRTFRISFKICGLDAVEIPGDIKSNQYSSIGMGSKLRFDRIHVSNIMDLNYLGIEKVLATWSPLLSRNPHAAILGYFMNWTKKLPLGCLEPGDDFEKLLCQMIRDGKALSLKTREVPRDKMSMMKLLLSMPNQLFTEMTACSDTSEKFKDYLSQQKFQRILSKTGLTRREIHRISPQRVLGSMESKPLPIFKTDDSFYYNLKLTSHTWTERFVELTRSG